MSYLTREANHEKTKQTKNAWPIDEIDMQLPGVGGGNTMTAPGGFY
jgi:hypothetical protein